MMLLTLLSAFDIPEKEVCMQTIRRRISRLLLVVTLLSLIPRGSASAMPRGFTTQVPATVPAILDAPPNNYRPAGAGSDVIPASYADEIGPQLEPTHQPGFFDGTFSGAARKRTAATSEVFTLVATSATSYKPLPFTLPAYKHDSIQLDAKARGTKWTPPVGDPQYGGASAFVEVKPITGTEWFRGVALTSPASTDETPFSAAHFTFNPLFIPTNVAIEVRFGCQVFYNTSDGSCTFANVEFFDDAPGWERYIAESPDVSGNRGYFPGPGQQHDAGKRRLLGLGQRERWRPEQRHLLPRPGGTDAHPVCQRCHDRDHALVRRHHHGGRF
jgi:hypothetical protein